MHNLLQYSYYYTRSGYAMEDGGVSTEVFQRKKRLKRWCINQSFQIAMYLINKIRAILAMEVCGVEAYFLCEMSHTCALPSWDVEASCLPCQQCEPNDPDPVIFIVLYDTWGSRPAGCSCGPACGAPAHVRH